MKDEEAFPFQLAPVEHYRGRLDVVLVVVLVLSAQLHLLLLLKVAQVYSAVGELEYLGVSFGARGELVGADRRHGRVRVRRLVAALRSLEGTRLEPEQRVAQSERNHVEVFRLCVANRRLFVVWHWKRRQVEGFETRNRDWRQLLR